jgi:hypothetical protein
VHLFLRTKQVGVVRVEDVKHVPFECPADQHLRARTHGFLAMPCLMVQPRVSNCDSAFHSLNVITRTNWHTICLYDDCVQRPLLVTARGSHIAITNVQQIVEEDVELITIHQWTLSPKVICDV